MSEDRPAWSRRMTNEREARSWSQADAVRAMQAHAATDEKVPDAASLLRQWKRWEPGEVTPSDFYKTIIARTFGTVTHACSPCRPSTTPKVTYWRSPEWTP
jgi:hypothetical protein